MYPRSYSLSLSLSLSLSMCIYREREMYTCIKRTAEKVLLGRAFVRGSSGLIYTIGPYSENKPNPHAYQQLRSALNVCSCGTPGGHSFNSKV